MEVKLRQYKTGKYKVNFVDKDVFGNLIHEEESEVLLNRGGHQKETPEERRARCMKEGTCFKCNAKDHKSYECPKRRRQNETVGSSEAGMKKIPPPPLNNVKITFGPGMSKKMEYRASS